MAYPRNLILAVVVGLLALSSTPADDAPKQNEKLRRELQQRAREDQEARQRLVTLLARQGAQDVVQAAAKKMEEIDRRNTAWLKEVVDKYGWPGKSLVGTEGAQKAWLLVQHADKDWDFQNRCLSLLARAVKKGEASPEQLAYLTDRVRVAKGRKQVYGTQFREHKGRMEPYPIEDEARVDARRKEVGLPPLAEYRKSIEAMYQPKAKAKEKK